MIKNREIILKKIQIIAEVGVNHNGDIDKAKEIIRLCSKMSVDFVKFQTFKTDELVTKDAELTEYQKKELPKISSQMEMMRSLELSHDEFTELYNFCNDLGISFLTTAFDFDSARFVNKLGLDYCKISSGEINNFPLIDILCQGHDKFFVSTGMATEDEIQHVINFLNSRGKNNITLMHCISEYPTPYDEMNLTVIKSLSDRFVLPVGLSDHSLGRHISLAAVSMGAVVIEKHVTLDNSDVGPDHKSSLEIVEFEKMVKEIRDIENATGNGVIGVSTSELKNRDLVRKSIVSKTSIFKGDYFTIENLTTKRPGTGLSGVHWFDLLNKKSKKNYKKDEMISIEEVWDINN